MSNKEMQAPESASNVSCWLASTSTSLASTSTSSSTTSTSAAGWLLETGLTSTMAFRDCRLRESLGSCVGSPYVV